jgi:hypothetical protein
MKCLMVRIVFTLLFASLTGLPLMAQSGLCRLSISMLNSTRHVQGEVNTECGPLHSLPWGNWGVESNFGDRTDSTQFTGWKWLENKWQWNSCTSEHPKDTTSSCLYYNHEHNGNGYCDDEGSNAEYAYATAWIDMYGIPCPRDTNYDGICDMFGCSSVTNISVSNQYLELYELDLYEFDDYVGKLYVNSNCCTISGIPCGPRDCGGYRYSSTYTTSYTPPAISTSATVRMRLDWGTFIDYTGYCAYLGNWDPSYNCW